MPVNITINGDEFNILAVDTQARLGVEELRNSKVDTQGLKNYGLLERAKNISGSDLNALVENGNYSGNMLSGAPDSGFYYVEVIRHGIGESYVLQRITGITGSNINKTFQRVKNNTVWTSWEPVKPSIKKLISAAELVLEMPLTQDGSAKNVLYSLKVDNLKPNDIVILLAQAEVTNPYDFTVGLGRYLVIANNQESVNGSVVAPAIMDNITVADHHKVIQMQAIDTGRTGTVFYNFVGYVASSNAKTGQKCTLEQGYGFVQALVISQ